MKSFTLVAMLQNRALWVIVVAAIITVGAPLQPPILDAHEHRSCCNSSCNDGGACPSPTCSVIAGDYDAWFNASCQNCSCAFYICRFRSQYQPYNPPDPCYICA